MVLEKTLGNHILECLKPTLAMSTKHPIPVPKHCRTYPPLLSIPHDENNHKSTQTILARHGILSLTYSDRGRSTCQEENQEISHLGTSLSNTKVFFLHQSHYQVEIIQQAYSHGCQTQISQGKFNHNTKNGYSRTAT